MFSYHIFIFPELTVLIFFKWLNYFLGNVFRKGMNSCISENTLMISFINYSFAEYRILTSQKVLQTFLLKSHRKVPFSLSVQGSKEEIWLYPASFFPSIDGFFPAGKEDFLSD